MPRIPIIAPPPEPWYKAKRERIGRAINRLAHQATKELGAHTCFIVMSFEDGESLHMIDGGTAPTPSIAELCDLVKAMHVKGDVAESGFKAAGARRQAELNLWLRQIAWRRATMPKIPIITPSPEPWDQAKRERIDREIDRLAHQATKELGAHTCFMIVTFLDGDMMHLTATGTSPTPSIVELLDAVKAMGDVAESGFKAAGGAGKPN